MAEPVCVFRDRPGHRPMRYSQATYAHLIDLARYLVDLSEVIESCGGLRFGLADSAQIAPPPDRLAGFVAVQGRGGLPPLMLAPLAGIEALPGEGWSAYWQRVFGIAAGDTFLPWLQAPQWRLTDPGAEGAGLRIAYALEYGVPEACLDIARGLADADYTADPLLWDKLQRLRPLASSETAHRATPPHWAAAQSAP